MDVQKGLRELEGLIKKLERNNRTLKSHPTIEKIERGELTKAQLRHWATQLFIGNKAQWTDGSIAESAEVHSHEAPVRTL